MKSFSGLSHRLMAALLALALVTLLSRAEAGIIVSIESKTIIAGSSDTLDVFVSKDAGDPDWNVLFAQYSFLITPGGGPGPGPIGSLEFDAVQPDNEATDPDPGYLFAPFAPTANFSGLQNGQFQYDGGDFTNDIADLATIGAGDLLLARLNISHILPFATPPGAADGSTYLVSLIDANSDFLDDNFNPVAFAGSSGTITISGAAAVPEPGTFGALAVAGLFLGWRKHRQRKKHPAAERASQLA